MREILLPWHTIEWIVFCMLVAQITMNEYNFVTFTHKFVLLILKQTHMIGKYALVFLIEST